MDASYWILAGVAGAMIGVYLLIKILNKPVNGLYLYIASTAVLVSPSLPLVGEKVALPEFILLATFLSILVHGARYRLTSAQELSIQLSLLFLMAVILAFLISLLSFGWDYIEYSLVETVNYIYGIVLFITVVILVQERAQWENCIRAYVVGASIVSFVGVVAFLGYAPGWAYDEFTGRISSTLRMSNQVPSYLGGVFLFVLFFSVAQRGYLVSKTFAVWLLIAIFVTMLGTGSRTALGLLLMGLMFAIIYVIRGYGRKVIKRQLVFVVPFVLILALGAWLMPQFIFNEGYYIAGETAAYLRPFLILAGWETGDLLPTDTTRLKQVEVALNSIMEFPLFGVGPAVFQPFYKINEIHNTFLGIAAESGLVGLVAFLLWLMSVFRVGKKYVWGKEVGWLGALGWAAMAGFMLLLIYGLVIFGLRQRHFWILAGLIVALPSLHRRRHNASRCQASA